MQSRIFEAMKAKTGTARARHTLGFKQKSERLVEAGFPRQPRPGSTRLAAIARRFFIRCLPVGENGRGCDGSRVGFVRLHTATKVGERTDPA